ncbi:MAG: LLM class flavin-dependent oxidoreductase [Betaproteobacteria bacterium]|nr:LLM class flavin-dependent oxidoreductase [Betaproteobacteria bacterium]
MQVFIFHLMPYAHMDLNYEKKWRSSWVVMPNSEYDPVKGHELYNRYLDELELAAELGLDGLAVNEHHQTAYGLMPSPVVMAAALSRRVKKAKIAILGNAFCLREHPLTLAEEHAMIDNITAGRMITGMVRGIGAEYHSMGVNPAMSHERFHEAHDLVVQAWTRPGPFEFHGNHYHFEYVNPWPRPFQKPHPPIWCPSTGSTETIEWAAHPDRKYVYLQTYSPVKSVAKFLNQYRETAKIKYGYEADSRKVGWAAPIFIADTDEKARELAKPHIEAMFNKFLNLTFEMMFPPGYVSLETARRMATHKKQLRGGVTVDHLIAEGIALIGTPDTVRKKLQEAHRLIGFQNFLALLQFGTLPRDLTEQNIRRFCLEVAPTLQSLTDKQYMGLSESTRALAA